jgi:hypothetical protein
MNSPKEIVINAVKTGFCWGTGKYVSLCFSDAKKSRLIYVYDTLIGPISNSLNEEMIQNLCLCYQIEINRLDEEIKNITISGINTEYIIPLVEVKKLFEVRIVELPNYYRLGNHLTKRQKNKIMKKQ